MLLFEIGAQERMREAHAGCCIHLGLAPLEARAGEAERSIENRRQERKQNQRDRQLDQCEAANGALHIGFLAPIFNVHSETARSPPLSLGNRTSTLTRYRRVASASESRSRSSVVFAGVYAATFVSQRMRPLLSEP